MVQHDRIRQTSRTRVWGVLLLGLIGCHLLGAPASAADRVLEVSQPDPLPVVLTEYFSVFEDVGARLTLADIRQPGMAEKFKGDQPPAAALSFGFTPSAYWLRLSLRNASDQPMQRMLEIGHSLISSMEFHYPVADGTYQSVLTGSATPFATRPHKSRLFVLPVTVPAFSDQVIFLRLQSTDGLLVPALLWEAEAFYTHERNDYFGQSLYFGIATMMVLFNLMILLALRESIYLVFVSFIVGSALSLAAANGLAHEYLWPQATSWSEISHFVGFALSLAMALLLLRRMLDTTQHLPRIDRLVRFAIGLLLLAPIGFAVSIQTFAKPGVMLNLLAAILFLAVGLYCVFRRQRSAYFLMVAFFLAVIGGLLTILRGQGLLPTNMLTMNGLQIGSALQMLLLAFALADRVNEIRSEHESAQQSALRAQEETLRAQTEALRAEQQLVDALRSSERLLERRVSERTAELSTTIDHLKQTQADLVQAEKLASLGALVAGVAHELNTPIGNALVTASGLETEAKRIQTALKRGGITKSALESFIETAVPMAGLIAKSCDRAATLISSFARVAIDQAGEERCRFDLGALVQDNVAALRPSFKSAPWVIEIDIAEGILLDSYPGPLGQVVFNLVLNAVSHAFQGRVSGRMTISAKVHGAEVAMTFTDDGNGIDAAVQERIFEPFYTPRLGQGGSGLGLSISLNIVIKVLGGQLNVSSEPGQGACFRVKIPLMAPVHHPHPQSELSTV